MNLRYVIAIDGPCGSGKSTVAREVAKRLGYRYIDTGAMYRAAALSAEREGVDLTDRDALARLMQKLDISQEMEDGQVLTFLSRENVSDRIRKPDMSMKASRISAVPEVRGKLLAVQRKMGESGGVVMEGRDIGTVVFPEADFKFYLTASDYERARRRQEEQVARGDVQDFEAVLEEIRQRDLNDITRETAPLRRAPGAVEIDSTHKTVEQVVEEMIAHIGAFGGERE